MKLFIAALILFSANVFAQNSEKLSRLELEQNIKENLTSVSDFPVIQFQEERKRKSPGLAILYSVLLPGMGELYAGSYSTGIYFTIAEGALWGTYIGMRSHANWKKDRYTSYAASAGEVNTSGKDADFFANITDFVNVEDYNNAMALDRDFNVMYDEQSHYWNWGTEANRKNYRNMWVSSEQAFNDIRFVVGALIVNRIASAVNAVRLVSRYNKSLTEDVSWNISAGLITNPDLPSGISLNFRTGF